MSSGANTCKSSGWVIDGMVLFILDVSSSSCGDEDGESRGPSGPSRIATRLTSTSAGSSSTKDEAQDDSGGVGQTLPRLSSSCIWINLASAAIGNTRPLLPPNKVRQRKLSVSVFLLFTLACDIHGSPNGSKANAKRSPGGVGLYCGGIVVVK